MPNVIAYICDQKVPHCKDVCLAGRTECIRTLDRGHSRYHPIDPEKADEYPERFVKIGTTDEMNYYEEVLPKH